MLAMLVESTVEYLFSHNVKLQPYLNYVALAMGILACLVYKVDLLAILGLVSPMPYVGSIASGLIVGRGSNYLNDFISRVRGENKVPTVKAEPVA